jgi:hypothetical protein
MAVGMRFVVLFYPGFIGLEVPVSFELRVSGNPRIESVYLIEILAQVRNARRAGHGNAGAFGCPRAPRLFQLSSSSGRKT